MSKKRLEFLKDTFLGLDLQMADDEASNPVRTVKLPQVGTI